MARQAIAVWLGVFLSLPIAAGAEPVSQCSGAEVPVFHCEIGAKNLSVCRLDDGRVSYRYGKLGEPEITIDSVARLSSRAYPGGGESRLRFSRGDHDYLVYSLMRNSGSFLDEETGEWLNTKEDRGGVLVMKGGKRVADLGCTGGWDNNGGIVITSALTSKEKEAFVDLPDPASADAGSSGGAPSPPDDFDARRSLDLVYGRLETRGDAAVWKTRDEQHELTVLAALDFREAGAVRKFLIVQLVPAGEEYDCHVCSPGVGAATFTRTADGWRLDALNRYVSEVGSWGKTPTPEIVKLGPERHGVVFPWGYLGQGQTHRGEVYFVEAGETVNEVLRLNTYYDNAGACVPEGEEGHPCDSWTSTVEFVEREGAELFDLKVATSGTEDGELRGEVVYSYSDGSYRETPR